MMLEPKQSADMGKIVEYVSKIPTAQFIIEHESAIEAAWAMTIIDVDGLPEQRENLVGQGKTFALALAELSRLVYEEQLKTKE